MKYPDAAERQISVSLREQLQGKEGAGSVLGKCIFDDELASSSLTTIAG